MTGEFAPALSDPFGNIVARALGALPRAGGIDLVLEKALPVAAGLGGGSADAGAVFRVVKEMHGLPDDWHSRAARLGADVPACVESVACIGRGTGTELEPIANDLAGTPVLLVNPRVPISTASAFAAWDGQDDGPLSGSTVREIATGNGNSFERLVTERLGIEPVAAVLAALSDTASWLHRLSGSGATCFALYETPETLASAAHSLRQSRPEWWFMEGVLR